MRKLLPVLLLLLVFAASAHAQCTGSSPTWTSTADQGSVQTCINNASNGDTINVSGTATWTTTVTISGKYVTLNGGGTTVITMNSTTPYGSLDVTANSAGHTVITGFQFHGHGIPGTSPTPLVLKSFNPSSPQAYRVYNNTFEDTTSGPQGVVVETQGQGPGLFDHNTLTIHHAAEETFHNNGIFTNPIAWTSDVVPGGLNMVFIENNAYIAPGTITQDIQAMENFYGAVVVFRYNTLGFGVTVDGHGVNQAPRWLEIYQNTYNIQAQSPSYHLDTYGQMRGGSGVYYNNHSTGSPSPSVTPGFNFGPNSGSGDIQTGSWPLSPGNVGRGINQTYSPFYYWGNDSPIPAIPSSNHADYAQIGNSPTSSQCVADATTGHPANVCDVVYATTQPAMIRCQSAADVSSGCPFSYTYSAAIYPHPLDNCLTTQFGAGATCGSSTPPPPANGGFQITAVPLPSTTVTQPTITSVSPTKTYVTKNGCSQDGAKWLNPCNFRVFCTDCDGTTQLALDGVLVTQTFVGSEMDTTVPLSLLPVPSQITVHSFTATNPDQVIPILQ